MPDDPHLRPDMRGERAARRRERRIAEAAERQHGVVSRTQLLKLGFEPGAIDRRIARGGLRPLHRGVYAVGHRILTAPGRWMAAVLAGGPGAVLSHRAAAALHGLGTAAGRAIDVSAPRRKGRRAGIRFHEAALPANEVTDGDGIPVTTVARTLLDLAGVLDREHLEQAIARAEGRGLGDSPSLPELVERYARFRGRAQLRAILGEGLGGGVARSELEVRFLRFLRLHDLPRPQLNVWLELDHRRVEADCVWRERSLIAELDSRAHHADWAASEADRARDRALVAAGWRCVRITWRQLRDEPDGIAADLGAALSR